MSVWAPDVWGVGVWGAGVWEEAEAPVLPSEPEVYGGGVFRREALPVQGRLMRGSGASTSQIASVDGADPRVILRNFAAIVAAQTSVDDARLTVAPRGFATGQCLILCNRDGAVARITTAAVTADPVAAERNAAIAASLILFGPVRPRRKRG